ncbi:MAG: hypothetical protein JEZ00_12040 [Anaerolineaceae bacterium]|nr:hypothetical protein [Anaerolineaceae bacterium]
MNRIKRLIGLFVILGLIGGAAPVENVKADTLYRVNVLVDDFHTPCTQIQCSLRAAINAANPGETIRFAESLSRGIIYLQEEIVLDKDINIDGSSLDEHINISGENDHRVFYVNQGVTAKFVNINIVDGLPWGEYGGAIFNDNATVTLDHVEVTGHIMSAIYNNSDDVIDPAAKLNVRNSYFAGNAGGDGGAIGGKGTVDISNSYFVNNNATSDGGAIHHLSGLIRITNSTFSENYAQKGGAVSLDHGELDITNSTFYENYASLYAGGAVLAGDGTNVSISNCTFSDNTATVDGASLSVTGFSTLALNNNIFANNGMKNYCNISNSVSFTYTNNLLQTLPHDNQCGAAIIVDDPLLGGLTDNGGDTLTMMPNYLSPVIDAGDNTTCELTDQRGIKRPIDGDKDSIAVCDIGAVEFNH